MSWVSWGYRSWLRERWVPGPYAGHRWDHGAARAAASTLVPTPCPLHISLPPAPARGDPTLNLIAQWVSFTSASLIPPSLCPCVTCPLSRWGCFSLPPIKATVGTLSALPGTGWDSSGLDSEVGWPGQNKLGTFLPGQPTESFPVSLLYLDCLTNALPGTSLQRVTTQEPPTPKRVRTWPGTHARTHMHTVVHTSPEHSSQGRRGETAHP